MTARNTDEESLDGRQDALRQALGYAPGQAAATTVSALIYIDRQILHEVTSPQAFEGLRLAGRKPWRIDANIATPGPQRADHQGRAPGRPGVDRR